jgi:hypothetical protein
LIARSRFLHVSFFVALLQKNNPNWKVLNFKKWFLLEECNFLGKNCIIENPYKLEIDERACRDRANMLKLYAW